MEIVESANWSLADLLLFGAVFTALAAGTAIFLAESWFRKMRQRREHFKIWQERQLKIWQEQQRASFLRLGRDEQGFDDQGNPGPWSSITWCRGEVTYGECGHQDHVEPPTPPVLKELRNAD